MGLPGFVGWVRVTGLERRELAVEVAAARSCATDERIQIYSE